MSEERLLRREEIPQLWEIDRSEVIEQLYSVEAGQLVLRPEFYDMRGWPQGEAEHYTPILLDCFDRGGWFLGLYDQGRLIGAVVLDTRRLGPDGDCLQLKFLHISHAYRSRGLGAHLFRRAAAQARLLGASALYVSATPSQNTVDFYRRLGCSLCAKPDEELYRLEPEDIHLIYRIQTRETDKHR
ncbi:N-acetyltransferase [Ectopseudomonas hydrolytica]|uniref:N-acetyltransferase n=1 Tax=Ectopseudomonas hydrolytica TaxID=2493633 RepID=A0ABY5A6B3_9GAMM|nr:MULTISPECIES: N-acetyltransferase [Pseudomonas]MDH0096625.1 N-acetyltransferase [Pseudomonas sp. GD04158]USR38488.1 N-acetyltransferase [Pseudomonas hydrolytica]